MSLRFGRKGPRKGGAGKEGRSGRGKGGLTDIPRAVLLVACGRAEGLALFGATPDAFLAGLAPWLGFLIVGGLLLAATQPDRRTLATVLSLVCALLAPFVLSELLARRWQRGHLWLRYATAYVWCQWATPFVGGLALVVTALALHGGLGEAPARLLLVVLVCGYGFWLHWFIARQALALGRWRAALLVAAVTLGTVALLAGPRLLAGSLGG